MFDYNLELRYWGHQNSMQQSQLGRWDLGTAWPKENPSSFLKVCKGSLTLMIPLSISLLTACLCATHLNYLEALIINYKIEKGITSLRIEWTNSWKAFDRNKMLILRNNNAGDLWMTEHAYAVISSPGSLQDLLAQHLQELARVSTWGCSWYGALMTGTETWGFDVLTKWFSLKSR